MSWDAEMGDEDGDGEVDESYPYVDQEDCHDHLRTIVGAALGVNHTVVLDENGLVYTWGKSEFGGLGHGEKPENLTVPRPRLVKVLEETS